MMVRNPRAPVRRSSALRAIARQRIGSEFRSTLPFRTGDGNCLTSAFFGLNRIRTNAASSSSSRSPPGKRPTKSGNQAKADQIPGSTSTSTWPTCF